MLLINECGFSSAPHEQMKKTIAALCGEGARSYLIVPEQQTLVAEAEMARELPEGAPLFFEVTNFTRLADSVFRALGGVSKRSADSATRSLVMWRALTELSPMLDMTRGKSDINDGLVKKALSAIDELNCGAVDTEELFALCDSTDIPQRLRSKISDISKISSLFSSMLESGFGSSEDTLVRCAKALSDSPGFLRGTVFFIEGFTSFTEPQYKVISELMRRGDVQLYLSIPKYDSEGFEFTELQRTKSRAAAIADKLGVEKKQVKSVGYDTDKPQLLNEIIRLTWRTEGEIDNEYLQNADTVRVFEAQNPFDECDLICADIKRRIMGGESYSDFAIIARSPEEYLGVLDVALGKFGIPYFMSRTHDASEYEAVKFIYSAYAAVGGFSREDVISYMKCGLCDLSRDDADELEIYLEGWSLSGKRLIEGGTWNMNPDGYTLRRREDTDAELVRINAAKEKLLAPLIKFGNESAGIHSVREHAEILFNFLSEMKVEDKLSTSEIGIPLWRIIIGALDTATETLGDMQVSREVFLSQLKILFRSVGMGKIPAFIDEITVGGAQMLRLFGKRHIYLIGVNQGKFPASPKDESYFNEKDKLLLSAHGINVTAELDLRSARELFFLSRAISFAKESLTVSYSLSGTDFKPLRKSDFITRLSEISSGAIKPRSIDAIERVYSPSSAKELIGRLGGEQRRALERALTDCGEPPYPPDARDITNGSLCLGEEARAEIYRGELALTQTRIDSFVKCPLSYFCKYNLSLREVVPYEVGHSDIGTFVHAILENFFRSVNENGLDVSTLPKEKLERLTYDSASGYMNKIYSSAVPSAQTKIMLDRIYRATLPVVEDICEELSNSRFSPKFFELDIRKNTPRSPEPISFDYPEGEVTVYGQIDRVDTYESGDNVYVRVIDYKTGNKHFSPDDLKKGENLQMFLYLKSIIDSKNPSFIERIGAEGDKRLIPAGVIYVKTSPSDVKVDTDTQTLVNSEMKKSRERRGMILDDPEAIAAQSPDYIPVKYKKDGTPTVNSEKYLYTPDGWGELMGTLGEVVGDISRRMRCGEIRAFAKGHDGEKLPCEYCEYKPICRKSAYL